MCVYLRVCWSVCACECVRALSLRFCVSVAISLSLCQSLSVSVSVSVSVSLFARALARVRVCATTAPALTVVCSDRQNNVAPRSREARRAEMDKEALEKHRLKTVSVDGAWR